MFDFILNYFYLQKLTVRIIAINAKESISHKINITKMESLLYDPTLFNMIMNQMIHVKKNEMNVQAGSKQPVVCFVCH